MTEHQVISAPLDACDRASNAISAEDAESDQVEQAYGHCRILPYTSFETRETADQVL
jgi:hypothetical protein